MQAVLNCALVLGGRRYVRGDRVDLTEEEIELYSRRGICEVPVTKAVEEVDPPEAEQIKVEPPKYTGATNGKPTFSRGSGRR